MQQGGLGHAMENVLNTKAQHTQASPRSTQDNFQGRSIIVTKKTKEIVGERKMGNDQPGACARPFPFSANRGHRENGPAAGARRAPTCLKLNSEA